MTLRRVASACLERRFVVFVRDLHVRRVDGVWLRLSGDDRLHASGGDLVFDVGLCLRWLRLERFVVHDFWHLRLARNERRRLRQCGDAWVDHSSVLGNLG